MVRRDEWKGLAVGLLAWALVAAQTGRAGEWQRAGATRTRTADARSGRSVIARQPAPPSEDDAPEPRSDSLTAPGEPVEIWEDEYPPVDYGCGSNFGCGVWYADFDLLLWWRSGQDIPALVTTSTDGTAQADAGVLGLPTTTVLLGNQEISDGNRVGGRVSVGTWFDPCQVNGVLARFYSLADDHATYGYSSSDYPILGRPFFNVTTSAEDARLVAYPGLSTGSIDVETRSDFVGGDVVLRLMLNQGACWRLDLIGGYQAARIDESIRIRDSLTSTATGGNIPFGTVVDVEDYFGTRNTYHAGVVGAIWEYDNGCGALSLRAAVGLGNMRQEVTVRGSTTTTAPGGPATTVDSGFLTQPSNIGNYVQDEFAVAPELSLRARWYLSDRVALTAGYTLLYYSQVARPGEQIDRSLNLTQVPGPIVGESRPAFQFHSGSLLLHGVQLGIRAEF